MDKNKIIAEIIVHHKQTIDAINNAYQVNSVAADIDEESVLDKEDYSRQNEATGMKLAFKDKLLHAKNELSFVEANANQTFNEAVPGSVIQSETEAFYLGVSFKQFEIGGIKVYGVSKDAPIYKQFVNKKVGDTFEINNQKHAITMIN